MDTEPRLGMKRIWEEAPTEAAAGCKIEGGRESQMEIL
jgi:hypothetical protein